MKAFVLSLTLLVFCAAASAQTWQPTVNMNTTGYSDSWNRTVVRTKSNVVYYVMNHSAISSGASQVRVYKGNAATPTAFTEMDAAHEPTDSSRIIGVDARLNDTTGIISIAYQLTSPLQARYITFDTATDTFGAVETISSVNHAPALRYLSKVSLALDPNGVPHATFGGDNEGLFYSNRIGGTWSAKFTLSSNSNDMHPSLTFGTDGVLHLAWLGVDSPRRIFYRERAANGTWSATETVDGAVGTVGDKVDQSPSIALSIANLPLVLYHEQSDTNANVIIKQRNGVNSYSDVSPTPVNTARGHDWAITVDWAGNWTICGHGNPNASPIEPQCMTRNNATGTWSGLVTLINDGTTHDGSASLRYDAVWPGDQSHLDLAYFDENNTPDSFYMSANITGPTNGEGTPTATLSTSSLTFADQIVGTTSAGQNVSVTNTGGGSLTITSITAPAGFAETDNCIAALTKNQSCSITVTFQPSTVGSKSGNLVIVHNDSTSSPQMVALSGVATDFSFQLASGAGETATLTKATAATYSLSVSGASDFADIVSFACAGLPQNTQCTFAPTSATPGAGATSVKLSVSRINNTASLVSTAAIYQASIGLAALVLVLSAQRRSGRLPRIAIALSLFVLVMAVAAGVSGCGGGNNGSVQPPPTIQPATGTYQFTVKATALGQSKTPITLTLVVQ